MAQTWDWFSSQSPDAPFAEKVMVAMGYKAIKCRSQCKIMCSKTAICIFEHVEIEIGTYRRYGRRLGDGRDGADRRPPVRRPVRAAAAAHGVRVLDVGARPRPFGPPSKTCFGVWS